MADKVETIVKNLHIPETEAAPVASAEPVLKYEQRLAIGVVDDNGDVLGTVVTPEEAEELHRQWLRENYPGDCSRYAGFITNDAGNALPVFFRK